MNQVAEYLKPDAVVMSSLSTCGACVHASQVRAYTEVILCNQLGKMRNADQVRECFGFKAKK